MREFTGYKHGVNLGGWLSQCEHTKKHYDTFIVEDDFKKIAGWGVDHVRLPVDYNLVQNKDGSFIESGFAYIDKAIEWAKKHGLNMVLDLHKTQGFSFDDYSEHETGFWESDVLEGYFYSLWEEFARRYGNESILTFELLNEITDKSYNEKWMKIAESAVAVIRKHAKNIRVIFGGYYNNSVVSVKDLAMPFDENIVYTFHSYEPLLFTHQGAYWVKEMDRNFRMKYPVSKTEYKKLLTVALSVPSRFSITDDALSGEYFNEEYYENMFREAMDVAEERNVPLYVGEYGVIDLADPESTRNWYKDINSVFEKYNISRCAWNYKGKDFGLDNPKYDSVRMDFI